MIHPDIWAGEVVAGMDPKAAARAVRRAGFLEASGERDGRLRKPERAGLSAPLRVDVVRETILTDAAEGDRSRPPPRTCLPVGALRAPPVLFPAFPVPPHHRERCPRRRKPPMFPAFPVIPSTPGPMGRTRPKWPLAEPQAFTSARDLPWPPRSGREPSGFPRR